MKNVNLNMKKWYVRSLVASFMLFFLFSIDLSAQHYPSLVNEVQAETMLENEIPHQEAVMNSFPQGTAAHIVAERRYHMYMHTWELLTNGTSLSESLDQTYIEFAAPNANRSNDFDEMAGKKFETVDYGDEAFDTLVTFLRN